MRRVLVLLFLAFLSGTAVAGKFTGVTMSEAATVDGKPLVLNGMELRKATVVGLYLENKSRSPADILRAEQVKRFDAVLLRDVDRDDIVDAWRKGLKKSGGGMAKLKARFDQFVAGCSTSTRGYAHVPLRPGRRYHGDPQGKVKGTIVGADFATALLAMWLGLTR